MSSKRLFGTTKSGEEVYIYELANKNGMKAEIIDYGAILVSLSVPNADGKVDDIVLGYDNLAQYEENGCFFGATIAPSANRIGNAAFSIDGVEYKVDVNDGPNNLHTHFDNGSHKKIWDVVESEHSVTFTLDMPDMENGFPGNKKLSVVYLLTDDNELKLIYTGSSDKNTLLNPTNHTYFNLSGHASGKDILDNILTLKASKYTYIAPGAIPTGELTPVEGTIMDFTNGRRVGDNIDDDFEQLVLTKGYDHNFVIDNYDGELKFIAKVEDKEAKRTMEVYTDLPGVQFYAGNCIEPQKGKDGASYDKRSALCLETQYFPDSINKPEFPSCVFGPGNDYVSVTVYKFV